MHMRILASPVTQITCSFGNANCAPIAAGSPNPIVPNPPELIHLFGLSNL